MPTSPLIAAAFCLVFATTAFGQRVVFEGEPLKKIERSFESATEIILTPDDAFEVRVRIVERNGRFYWQSRGMRKMTRSESGAYITYSAVDGSGYVRTFIPMMMDLRRRLPEKERGQEIDYTEHLLIQLQSITYFGNRLQLRQ